MGVHSAPVLTVTTMVTMVLSVLPLLLSLLPPSLPSYSPSQLEEYQNNLSHMGNRKYQPVPSLVKESIPKASTRLFVTPNRTFTGHPAWPSKILGLYILLADDTEDGFDSAQRHCDHVRNRWIRL